ncbi:MAG: succinate dehydrogenase, hydrophobic membrane anchor protein [Pseudomonadota bacterium]
MAASQDFTTPTARARGLGSAKAGTEHHIRQRVSAIALALLVPWFLFSVIRASQAGFEGAQAWAGQPWNAILLLLTFSAAFYHMRLGMQVVIEDYIYNTGLKSGLLIANTFAAIALFAITALSVLNIWISAGAAA